MTGSRDEDLTSGVVEQETPAYILVGQERVIVAKHEAEHVAARISLRTRTEETPVSEELRSERAEIVRVPVDRIVAEAPEVRVENGVMILPVVEEVLVRQFRIVEELRITNHVDVVTHTEIVSLRRQEAIIDSLPDSTD